MTPVTSPSVTAVLFVRPCPPVTAKVMADAKLKPPSFCMLIVWFGGMPISAIAVVVPSVTLADGVFHILIHLVEALLFVATIEISLPPEALID